MTKKGLLFEIFGWGGTAAVLIAYALVSWRVLSPDSFAAACLNLLGGLGIASLSIKKRAYQPAFLNVFWAAIALIVLLRR